MRIVLDTNVLISALITDGRSRELVKALLQGDNTVLLSEPILDEFLRVSSEDRLTKYVEDEEVTQFLGALLSRGIFVRIRSRFKVLNSPDDMILRTAVDGDADSIVSGDAHLLALKLFRGTKIVTVARILDNLGSKRSDVEKRGGRRLNE